METEASRKVSRDRHRLDESAVAFYVFRVRFMQHTARTHEKERFETHVVERVKECGDEGEGAEYLQAQRVEDHPHSEADQNDTDIFDGVVGQQRLDVVFAEGVEHADKR